MKRGTWHQFGDRSQRLALEQLEHGIGVGVVISPRDLSRENAIKYVPKYREKGADILVDQQFYIPDSTVGRLSTYETANFRQAVSQLRKLSESQLKDLASALRKINADLQTAGVISPAVVYEAGRSDIVELNAKLFAVAKQVGDELDIPTYSTIVLGKSVTSSDHTVETALSDATSVDAEGWYFAFEFDEFRIPTAHSSILRFCKAGLDLACTGKPVFHAYAGPLSLLSACFGATAVGIGHSQNLWQFTRDRWEPLERGGGGGDAPPRLFSASLWGTIIYEDEFALLSPKLREEVLTSSPFSDPISATPPYLPWSRWDGNKHLVYLLGKHAESALLQLDAEKASKSVIKHLEEAISLHSKIASEGVSLADNTNSYQNPWRAALTSLLAGSEDEFEFLRMIRGL